MQVENPGVREIEMTLEVISLLSTVVPSDSFTSKQQQRFESLKDVDERMDYYTVLIQLTVEGKMGLAYFLIQQIIDEIGEDAAVDEVRTLRLFFDVDHLSTRIHSHDPVGQRQLIRPDRNRQVRLVLVVKRAQGTEVYPC